MWEGTLEGMYYLFVACADDGRAVEEPSGLDSVQVRKDAYHVV